MIEMCEVYKVTMKEDCEVKRFCCYYIVKSTEKGLSWKSNMNRKNKGIDVTKRLVL